MKSLDNDNARRISVRAVMAYPALSVALVVAMALALTHFGTSQVMALATATTPNATTAPIAGAIATPTSTPTATPGPTALPIQTSQTAALPTPTTTGSPDVTVVVPDETLAPTGRSGISYPLLPPGVAAAQTTPATAVPGANNPESVSSALTSAAPAAVTEASSSIHGSYSMATDKCAMCHRSHTAKGRNLTKTPSPQSALCYTCHGGLGAQINVQDQFTDPLVPQNNDTTRMYYRHDTVGAIAHSAGDSDEGDGSGAGSEFRGVSNRHSECVDCHNPHQANGTDGTTTPSPSTGVTASGRLAGASGVSVVNGAAGTSPVYTLLDGKSPTTTITREYQLCFKCHSGFTTLSPNGGFGPSRYRLDKGVEFNPNNPSYHPIEAPGKNTTAAMTASLAGGTTWRLTTGSTIRCVNCHASSTRAPTTPALNQPPANGDLPMHTSRNPGILLAKYRNRVLMSATEPYSAANFALCYMCHSSAPFTDGSSTATNFDQHAKHVSNLGSRRAEGGTPDIDTIGGGRGNAVCAECHFRQHSTNYKIAGQTVPGSRLVSFSTNVSAYGGTLNWTKSATEGSGSCTLTCHTYNHSNKSYSAGGW